MVSTFTPNIQLEEPARGDYVGIWDTPVNSNMTVIDKVVGAAVVIALNNSPVVLSAAQFQSRSITFNSTLTGNVAVTFPTSFVKDYMIFNLCTGSSAFTITLNTTLAGGQQVGVPPGEQIQVYNYGTGGGLFFANMGRIGSYMDYAGSSVPAWITACTVPPYLNCDGSTFNQATYPQLAAILNGNTLPDSRGRLRAVNNQGTSRLLSSVGGLDGNTILAVGGTQATTLSSLHLPQLIDAGHFHTVNNIETLLGILGYQPASNTFHFTQTSNVNTTSNFTGITYGSSSQVTLPNVPPAYVGGITMIRAG